MPPPSAPARLQPTVTSNSRPIATAPATPIDAAAASDGVSRSVSTWFVTPIEAPAPVRVRADRGERVHVRPRDEDDEEDREEARDGNRQERLAEAEEEGAGPGDEGERRDDGVGVVDADPTEQERCTERDRRHQQRRPRGERHPGEDAERREGDEPGDEDERRSRPGVVRPRQPQVEACERCRSVGVGAGPDPRLLLEHDGRSRRRDVGQRDEAVDLVESEVSRPLYRGPTIAIG